MIHNLDYRYYSILKQYNKIKKIKDNSIKMYQEIIATS